LIRKNWLGIAILFLLVVLLVWAFIFFSSMGGINEMIGQDDSIEQISIQNVEFISNNSAVFTVHNVGSRLSTLLSAKIVNISSGNGNEESVTLEPSGKQKGNIIAGTSANFRVTFRTASTFSSGETYQFRLNTLNGNTINYQATYNPPI
jgi:hypothetical protein